MADLGLVVAVEQIGMRALAGERGGGERRDELLRALGQDAAHAGAALAQAADQVERLVGGDAAADDEKDALAREHRVILTACARLARRQRQRPMIHKAAGLPAGRGALRPRPMPSRLSRESGKP